MDLSKAFDTVNRTVMWTTLYKKGIPIQTIQQIWRGRQNTQLMAKSHNQYGAKVENNVGVFQGSAMSALLFIIYLDDMMEDYNALNTNKQITKRTQEKCELEQQTLTSEQIKKIYTLPEPAQQRKLLAKLYEEIKKGPEKTQHKKKRSKKLEHSYKTNPKKYKEG